MINRIAIVYTPSIPVPEGLPKDFFDEFDSEFTPNSIRNAIEEYFRKNASLGISKPIVKVFKADSTLENKIISFAPDVIFPTEEAWLPIDTEITDKVTYNQAKELMHATRELDTRSIYEKMSFRPIVLGSGRDALELILNKHELSNWLRQNGLTSPASFLITGLENLPSKEEFEKGEKTYIVKPLSGGSSFGIEEKNVVNSYEDMLARIEELYPLYGNLVVQEFIKGKEITVGVIGNEGSEKVLSVSSMELSGSEHGIASQYVKWKKDSPRNGFYMSELGNFSEKQLAQIREYVLKVKKVTELKDVMRVDIRISEEKGKITPDTDLSDRLYTIDVNATPGLQPIHSSLVLEQYDDKYTCLEKNIVDFTNKIRRSHYYFVHSIAELIEKEISEGDEYKTFRLLDPLKVLLDFTVDKVIHPKYYNMLVQDIFLAGLKRNGIELTSEFNYKTQRN